MPYIAREDGEHFVIPAYRDVLTYSNKTQLRKDILALSEKYGQYITLQKKGQAYEAAFSPDPGYLLGESVWVHFKRPLDMIYCEAVPNKAEAILVVVKEGSIYLDGQFPTDGIAEELIAFLTQQNQFAIYTYGDVPISQEPEIGKFSFEATAVRSYEVLSEPAFPLIKPNRNYQLRLVDVVLKANRIGVFPTTQIIAASVMLFLMYIGYYFYQEYQASMIEVFIPEAPPAPNPYSAYQAAMKSPAPKTVINACLSRLGELSTMPGWLVTELTCTGNSLNAVVVTQLGGSLELLNAWLKSHGYTLSLSSSRIEINQSFSLPARSTPSSIYPLESALVRIINDIMMLSEMKIIPIDDKKASTSDKKTDGVINKVQTRSMTLNMDNTAPFYLEMLAERMTDMPVVVKTIKLTFNKGVTSGSITFDVLGT